MLLNQNILNRILAKCILLAILMPVSLFAEENNALVVTATRLPQSIAEVAADISVLTREDIERSSSDSFEELISQLPGVQFRRNGGPGTLPTLFVRGTNKVVLVVDGQRVESATLGQPIWNIPISAIEQIELVRGGNSTFYGTGAMGAVIQVVTRKARQNKEAQTSLSALMVAGSHNMTKLDILASHQIDEQWALSLGIDVEKHDGINATTKDNLNYDADRDGFKKAGLYIGLNYAYLPDQSLHFSYLQNQLNSDYDGYDANRNEDLARLIQVGLDHWITDRWQTHVQLGRTNLDSQNYNKTVAKDFFNTTSSQATWQNEVYFDSTVFMVSFEALKQAIKSNRDHEKTTRSIYSVLGSVQQTWGSNEFLVSARVDDNSQFGSSTTSSFSWVNHLTDQWQIRSGYATAFRAPTFNDLYYPFSGNNQLKPETAKNVEAGLRFRSVMRPWGIDLTAYRHDFNDLIAWAPDSAGTWKPSNINQARFEGLTLGVGAKTNFFKYGLTFDYLKATNLKTKQDLIRRARRSARVYVTSTVGKLSWTLESQWVGSSYEDSSNTTRLKGFQLMNIKATYDLLPKVDVLLEVKNLLDEEYVLVKDYQTLGRTFYVGIRMRM